MASAPAKEVTITQEEYNELQVLKENQAGRKKATQARSKARSALIKKYQSEYDKLVKDFGGV